MPNDGRTLIPVERLTRVEGRVERNRDEISRLDQNLKEAGRIVREVTQAQQAGQAAGERLADQAAANAAAVGALAEDFRGAEVPRLRDELADARARVLKLEDAQHVRLEREAAEAKARAEAAEAEARRIAEEAPKRAEEALQRKIKIAAALAGAATAGGTGAKLLDLLTGGG